MKQHSVSRIGRLCLALSVLFVPVGCTKATDGASTGAPKTGSVSAAPPPIGMTPQQQKMSAQNAQGAEADARRRATAMGKATQP